MIVIIAGSRKGISYSDVEEAIASSTFTISEIVSGKANGVDTFGEEYAMKNEIPIKSFPANWSKYGKVAGPVRNQEMAEYADSLIAVWDGKSNGTSNMILNMRKLEKPVHIHYV